MSGFVASYRDAKMDGGVFSTAFVFAVDVLFSRAPGGRAYEADGVGDVPAPGFDK